MISRTVSGEVKPRFPAASQPSPLPKYHHSTGCRVPARIFTEKMHCISKRLSLSLSSITKYNRAFAETSNPVRELNVWIRSNSSASPAVADPDPDPDDVSPKLRKKSRKRIPKAERKMLLESFVKSYRAMNSGKFPTASEAQKEVGGSYYAVRKFIQEMEYESRMPSISLSRKFLKVGVDEKIEQLKEKTEQHEEVQLSGQETMVAELPLNEVSIVNFIEEKGVPSATIKGEVDDKKEQLKEEAECHEAKLSGQETVVTDFPTFAEEKEVSEIINLSCEKDPVSEAPITNEEIVKSAQPKTKEPLRDMTKEHGNNVESSKKLFGWNLKSIADGIVNFWRKL